MKTNGKTLTEEELNRFVEQIREVRAFSVLSDKELMEIVSQMRIFNFKAGTIIVKQGEPANMFFIVQKGTVGVSTKKFFFKEKQVATLETGDIFGESVLFSNSRRTATVRAKTDTTCFVLLKPSFNSILDENPLFRKSMEAVFSKRKLQMKNA